MNELMIDLENDSKKPLYQQIYEYIRNQTADGKISCGEKLPSTRLLSKHLQVSRSTVELAYQQLLAEGYIESLPYRGYYVSDISGLYLDGRQEAKKNPVLGVVKERGREDFYLVVFSPNKNDMDYFPYGVWRKITKNVLSTDNAELFLSGEAAGEAELREAVSSYLYHARGVKAKSSQIIIGAGNEYLLVLLTQVLGRQKEVAIENPTYLKAYRTFCNMECHVRAVSMDEGGICIEELRETDADVVYTMPSHQFPMGTVMPLKRRLELLHWASEKQGRYIIEDDHDSEFRYRGKPIPSLQGSDNEGKVIYIGTFSKSIGPSIRVSYMVLPEELLAVYERTCGFYSSTVAKEQQKVLAEFLSEGYFERHLNRMRGVYKGKHDYFFNLLKKEVWVQKIYGDNAGMHLLVEVNSVLSSEAIRLKASDMGVRIYTLEEYQIPKTVLLETENPTILLGYGGLSEDEMNQGVSVLRGILTVR